MPAYVEGRDGYGWTSSGTIADDLASDEDGVYLKLQSDVTFTKTIYVDKFAGAPVYIRKVLRFYEYAATGNDVNILTTGLVYNMANNTEGTNLPIAASSTLDVVIEGYAVADVTVVMSGDTGDLVKIYINSESGV